MADGHLRRLRGLEEHLHALLEAVELRDDLLGLGLVVALVLVDLADVDDALGPGLLGDLDLRMYTSSTARGGTLVGALKFDYGTAQDVARRDRVLLAAHARRGGPHLYGFCERRVVIRRRVAKASCYRGAKRRPGFGRVSQFYYRAPGSLLQRARANRTTRVAAEAEYHNKLAGRRSRAMAVWVNCP